MFVIVLTRPPSGAIEFQNELQVQLILAEGQIDVNEPGASERRALHRAAGSNQPQICELLVIRGATIDQVRQMTKMNLKLDGYRRAFVSVC